MEPILINVMEAYAKDEAEAKAARDSWMIRSLTLDIMYDNIPNLYTEASLETKGFIYDQLQAAITKIF